MSYEVTAGRTQQTIAAVLILALSLWIAFVSFNVKDPQPYLFPQLFSVVMVGLSVVAVFRALRGANRTGVGMTKEQTRNIAPAIILMLVYVFLLVPWLGFYAAGTVCLFTLYTLYDPNSHLSARTWVMRTVVTVGFMALIYLVFALGLRVQTPTGILL